MYCKRAVLRWMRFSRWKLRHVGYVWQGLPVHREWQLTQTARCLAQWQCATVLQWLVFQTLKQEHSCIVIVHITSLTYKQPCFISEIFLKSFFPSKILFNNEIIFPQKSALKKNNKKLVKFSCWLKNSQRKNWENWCCNAIIVNNLRL